MKKIVKLLIFISIISINLNCMMNGSNPVYIRSDLVELKQPISGSVGFCGFFFPGAEKYISSSQRYGNLFIGKNLSNFFNKDFLDTIDGKATLDCRYDTIKDFSYFWDYFHQKPFTYQMYYSNGKGYIKFYDELDQHGTWRMWSAAVDFFNKYYNCDYYLTGKFYMNTSEDSANKRIEIEPNIMLILYDNKGYKVWSKLYKKQYYNDEKNLLTPDTTYLFVKNMLNDNKEIINNDLSSLGIKSSDKLQVLR